MAGSTSTRRRSWIRATGRIADFITAPLEVRQGSGRAASRGSPRILGGALVAQHAIHVYARYTEAPAWQAFFDRMEELRSTFLLHPGSRSPSCSTTTRSCAWAI